MSIRTIARLAALPAATAAVALSFAAPAGAHVTATPSTAAAGAYTVVTFSVGHGCEGSPTTRLEIQVPESVLSVTPSRNPFYDVEKTIEQLDEPVADAHGNEVTERTASIVYTATTPLPDGQRDAFELSFQLPDAEGETLSFPTIQTCQKGETGWVEVPADGQDPDELESPAPAFEIVAAEAGSHGDEAAAEPAADEAEATAEGSTEAAADAGDTSPALGWIGLVAGLLGLAAGGLALARTRSSS
ncbi:YcnI family protein [Nocardioides sp. zg-1230]|uniref:YcnI family copper-binding membrane protein n=1 Tax=Nocardioides sp. zg-1230 TaxID=2736601 RepID=UPI001557C22E|nr:YcnI family protein [Nocardioides sp. zg-1230]NPC42676.1 YcnI family protein [Nocardioides sp. zg-1230]